MCCKERSHYNLQSPKVEIPNATLKRERDRNEDKYKQWNRFEDEMNRPVPNDIYVHTDRWCPIAVPVQTASA